MRAFIFLISFLLCSIKGFSCDCIIYPLNYYTDKVDFIFTGRIIEVLDSVDKSQEHLQQNQPFVSRGYRVKVLVIKKFKMGSVTADTLEFTSDYSNCDPFYILNKSYLFFANPEDQGKYKMAHCSPWDLLENSKKKIKKIKKSINHQNRG